MTAATWGTEGWGIGPWGAGSVSSSGPSLVRLKLIRTNVVRVWFDVAPRALDRSGFTDALNPRNWLVERADGSGLYAPEPVRVLPVQDPRPDPMAVDVWVVVPFVTAVSYRITPNPNILAA